MSFSFFMIFLTNFPTDLKHECLLFLIRLHRLSLVRLLLHSCHNLELTIHPDGFHTSASRAQTSSDPSPNSEGSMCTRADWIRDETSVLLEIWGALYDSLKSALTAQKMSVESNFKKIQDKCFVWGCHQTKTWINSGKE